MDIIKSLNLPFKSPFRNALPIHAWRQNSKRKNSWLHQFQSLFWVLRFVLRFPYTMTDKGELQIKFKSLSFLYWTVMYSIIAVLNAENFLQLFERVVDEKTPFLELIIAAYNINIMLYVCVYPVSFFSEFSSIAEVVNMWPDFEVSYERGVGKPIELKLRKRFDVVAAIIVPLCIFIVVLMKNVVFHVHWYSLSVHIVLLIALIVMAEYATVSVRQLMLLYEEIKGKIQTDLCSFGFSIPSAGSIANLRLAWLHLTLVSKAHFESWSFIGTNICVALQCVLIMTSFAIISELVGGKSLPIDLVLLAAASGYISMVIHNNGFLLAKKAGEEISEALAYVNITRMDRAAVQEVKLFMKVVRINNPVFTFGGIIVCNRHTITSLLSDTITYLIILLQMQTS